MKKKKTNTRIAKGVLLISFLILFIRLIFSFTQSWEYYKQNNHNSYSLTKKHKKLTKTIF